MGVIEAREGAPLAVGRVDAGLGRLGQVIAAVGVVEPGPFVVEAAFPVLMFGILTFTSHSSMVEEGLSKRAKKTEICLGLIPDPASGERRPM